MGVINSIQKIGFWFLIIGLSLIGTPLSGQTTIFEENFNGLADGTMAGVDWAVEQSNGCGLSYTFEVVNDRFQVNRARGFDCGCNGDNQGNNQNVIEFGPFDISNFCDVAFSFDFDLTANHECSDFGATIPFFCGNGAVDGHDMAWVEVIVDGTPQTLFYYCGNIPTLDQRFLNGINGNTISIRITSGNQAENEFYYFDNILIEGTEGGGTVAIDASPSTTFCEGTDVVLTAQSAGPWSWSGGAGNTQSITVSPNTSRTYTVTAGSGCGQGSGSITLNPIPNPTADAGANRSICFGNDVTLTASGGTMYTWNDPSNSTSPSITVSPTSSRSYSVTVSNGTCSDVDDVSVTVNAIPNVVAANDITICEGDDATLTANGADSYSWSPAGGGSTPTVNPTNTTTYSVTGTTNGCSNTDQLTVFVNPSPTANIAGTAVICQGETVTLTGSGGVNYQWDPANGSNATINVTPSTTTNYRVTVTDSDGCDDTDEFLITVQPLPIADAGQNQNICIGETATLIASGGSDYQWDFNNSSGNELSVSPASDMTYSVTVSNGMCSDVDQVSVFVNERPAAGITGDLEICVGETARLSAIGNGTYAWSGTTSTAPFIDVTPASTQDYSLTVTNNGCDSIVTQTVVVKQAPIVEIGNDTTICEGTEITLTATGATTYEWSDLSTNSTLILTPTSTQTISVTGTENGCFATAEIDITVQQAFITDAGMDVESCAGKDIILTASGASTFEWSDGSENQSITISPLTDTTYFVTATEGVCTDTDSVNITVTDGYELITTPDTVICAGNTIELTASAQSGVNFTWDDGSTGNSYAIQPTETTTYTLATTDGVCDISRDILVSIDDIEVAVQASDLTPCEGESISIDISSNGSFSWPDGAMDNTRDLVLPKDTTIIISAESNIGCIDRDSVIVSIDPLPEVLISGSPLFCESSMTIVDVSSGLDNYLWNDNDINSSKTIDAAGEYIVLGTDSNGCSNRDTIIVEEKLNPTPVISGSLTYCPGSFTELSVDVTFTTISWDVGGSVSQSPTLQVSQNATVLLTVEDEFGCMGDTSAIVEENASLNPVISGELTLCEDATTVLSAGDGFDDYLWSTNGTNNQITISSGGEYSVTVSTDDGCTGRDTFTVQDVTNPVVQINGKLDYCLGDSTMLTIDAYPMISWSTNSGQNTVSIKTPGPVSVNVEDINGCPGTADAMIIERALPDVQIIGDTIFCRGDSVRHTLNATFATTTWYDGSSMDDIYITNSQINSVEIADVFGCINSDTVTVVEKALPTPMISAPMAVCEGEPSKIFSISSHQSYSWNGQIGSDSLEIQTGGQYTLVVENEDGCIGEDEVQINTSVPPTIDFKTEIVLCNSFVESRDEPTRLSLDTVFASPSAAGTWSTNHSSIDVSNLPEIDFEGLAPGEYKFAYDTNDALEPCTNTSSVLIINVLDCQCPNVQFAAIDTLCSLGGMLDLGDIQSSDFEGTWQVTDGPSSSMPSISNDIFDADGVMPGEYELQFRLVDGIAPLGCEDAKSVNIVIADHIDASLELIDPACGDNPATIQVNLSGGSVFDLEILQGDGTSFRLDNISDGHQFTRTLSGTTGYSFQSIESDIPTCAVSSDQDIYLFSPGELEAEVELSEFGAYELSCSDVMDGSAAVLINMGTAPYTYAWSDGSSDASITGLAAGDYDVLVEDATGCIFMETISITAPPEKLLSIDPMDPNCGEGPGSLLIEPLTGTPNANDWELYLNGILQSQRSPSGIIGDLPVGSYQLEAINGAGCKEVHDFEIEDTTKDNLITTNDVTVALGQSVTLSPTINFDYASIVWSPSIYLNDSSQATVIVEQPLNSILYTIKITDIDGCVTDAIIRVNVDKDRSLMIPTGFSPNSDDNNDAFIIHAVSGVTLVNSISIFNRWGEQVFQAEEITPNEPVQWDWTFRNETLPSGQYIWQAQATFIDGGTIDFNGQFEIIR